MKFIYVTVQQGGSSSELYINASGTKSEANEFRRSCDDGSYKTSEPLLVPPALTKALLDNPLAEREFYSFLESVLTAELDYLKGGAS